MENQDSAHQGKKKFFSSPGRKKKAIILAIVLLVLIGMIGRGFAFSMIRGYRGLSFGRTGNVALVVKDFEPLGIVFAGDVAALWNGYSAAYDALMKEAAQKGADAIINVNISATGFLFARTWSGSALAIKYLDTILEGSPGISQVIEIPNPGSWLRRGWWFGRNRY